MHSAVTATPEPNPQFRATRRIRAFFGALTRPYFTDIPAAIIGVMHPGYCPQCGGASDALCRRLGAVRSRS